MTIRNRVKELRHVKASELRANPRNWRKHPASQRRGLEALLQEVGFADALIVREVNGSLELIDGHLRKDLMDQAEVPVLVLDVNEEEAHKLLVSLDPLAAMAEADKTILEDLIKDFKTQDETLKGLLDDVAKQNKIDLGGGIQEDEVPAVLPEAVSKAGDLWLLGKHRLLCGDSTKAEDVARVMNGDRAGLINTDPPYGVNYSKTKNGIPRPGFVNHQELWGDIAQDNLKDSALQSFLESVFKAFLPHLDHAAWYLWHAHLTQGFFAAAAAAADVILHRQIIWKKPGLVLTRSGMYHWAHEPCFFGWVRGDQPKWLGSKNQTSVWELSRDEDSGQHPTQKPVALFAIPIKNHLEVAEICAEPFSGSGSQLIAAEQLDRRCYAIEIEPRYVDVAVRRWQTLTGRDATLDGTGQTFAEISKG